MAEQAESPQVAIPPEDPVRIHDARRSNAGRPSGYRQEFCELVHGMCQAGSTDQELAEALEIHISTLYRWYAEHPELRESVKLGKEAADERVERSLYHRAVGYSFESVKIMQDKGVPVVVQYTEHVAPDPGAAFNWLKNRKPTEWRDRKEVTGVDGTPLVVSLSFVPGAGA